MDIALKQRLVGASVLIALAVVVLPMLLGGRPDEGTQEAQTIELPPQPSELDFQTRRYPVGETPAATTRASEETAPGNLAGSLPQPTPQSPTEGDTGPGAVAHVELEPRAFEDALPDDSAAADDSIDVPPGAAVEPVAAERAEAPPPSASKPVAAPAAAADGGRYVVQVASFGSIANADRLAETLRGSGYAVLTDKVSSDVGTLHRVRVGPYASEPEAKAAVTRLRQQLADVKPRVVDLQPERAAQVTTPSDPLVRWVVQLGSFSNSANAEKPVERVRAEGFSAYKEEISGSGATIHRVRVGPFLERDEAIRVDGLIGQRLSVDGVVMSAD
jgi:DedD protein